MSMTEEELRRRLESTKAERLGRSVKAGVESLAGNLRQSGEAVGSATFQTTQNLGKVAGGISTGVGMMATGASDALERDVVTPVRDFARGLTGGPAPEPTRTPLVQPEVQEAGLQDSIRAATQNPNSPVLGAENLRTIDPDMQFLNDAQRRLDQRNAPRGPETQLTRLGAFDSAGNQIGSANQRNQAAAGTAGTTTGDMSGTGVNKGRGTMSTVNFGNPVAQLASFRETFGSPGGRTGTGGFAFAPNSRARERNASLNDPGRQLISDLQRQVRTGQISARAAADTMATLIGQERSATTARERIAAEAAQGGAELALKREQLGQQGLTERQKLAAGLQESMLDRLTAQETEQGRMARAAATLGMDAEELAERRRANLTTEDIARQRLNQQEMLGLAGIGQRMQASGATDVRERLGQAQQVLKTFREGLSTPEEAANQLELLIGPEDAARFFPDMFTTE